MSTAPSRTGPSSTGPSSTGPSRTAASVLAALTVGDAWLAVGRRILDTGWSASWGGAPTREIANVLLDVAAPASGDAVIDRFGDPERSAWMRANFMDPSRVAELGGAASYFSRLHDHARTGRDQVAEAVERLRDDPTRRDVVITTLEPLLDTTYVPCVSLLDLWIPDGALELAVACHSIDFGTKGYGNLVQLAALQEQVATALDVPVGRLTMTVKTAHVYEADLDRMAEVLAAAEVSGPVRGQDDAASGAR